jgi:hypothetical protein
VISQSLSISRLGFLLACYCSLFGCSHQRSASQNSPSSELLDGQIEYPFAEESKRIGKNQNKEPFRIRSTVGNSEYQIELPGAADDYDVQLPLGEMPNSKASAQQKDSELIPNVTDREFEDNMPKMTEPDDRQLVESALGLGEANGPRQGPSYTLKLAKINQLYSERQYEIALVEINQLLSYYPTDPRLNKMKGTVLVKMRNFRMAEVAWTRASEFAPSDETLRQALMSLRKRISESNQPIQPTEPASELSPAAQNFQSK